MVLIAPVKHIRHKSTRANRLRFQNGRPTDIESNESSPRQETESQRAERGRAENMRQDAPFGGLKPHYVL
jgi:hypothetical protein